MGIRDTFLRRTQAPASVGHPLAEDVTSAAMQDAVRRWYRLYYGNESNSDEALRLCYTIVNKLTKTVFSEYASEQGGDGRRADGVREALSALDVVRAEAMQQCLIGGECLLKPVLKRDGFDFVVIRRSDYCVLERDILGRATGYSTAETIRQGGDLYTLVETRRVDKEGFLTIGSRLYRRSVHGLPVSASLGGLVQRDLGRKVPLDTLERYAGLCESVTLPRPVYSTGLVPLKTPMENCVDGSADGVSIFAAAEKLVETAGQLEAQLNREFANGASRIIASSDMLRDGPKGKRLDDDLFIALDDDPANVGIKVYSPDIRVESYLRRKNDNLRCIENMIGLSRGFLSDVEAVKRTATEIATSEGDYNLTIVQLQAVWAAAAAEALGVCGTLGGMYFGWGSERLPAPVFDFGDGVLFNRDKVWQEYVQMVQAGWLRPEVALAWYFSMDVEEDAEQIRGMGP